MLLEKKQAFSMIEILIWIFIFSLGLVSIYAIIISILKLNDSNKHSLIAWYIANEQIELLRNLRDSNYIKVQKYNQIDPNGTDFTSPGTALESNKFYKIESVMDSKNSFPVKIHEIINFQEWLPALEDGSMNVYQLCMTPENEYIYCYDRFGNKQVWVRELPFYKYIQTSEIEDTQWSFAEGFKVRSKVIWYVRGYHEFYIDTFITDWKTF